MDKQQTIEIIQDEINMLQKQIKNKEDKIIELQKSEEKDLPFMIMEYQKEKSKIVFKEIKTAKYTRILGGDGRSSPWDEQIEGKVLFVDFKNIFLSKDNLKRFVAYLKAVEDIAAVKINGVEF